METKEMITTGIMLFVGILFLKAVGGVQGLTGLFEGIGGLFDGGNGDLPPPKIDEIIEDVTKITDLPPEKAEAVVDIAAVEAGAEAAKPWMFAGGLLGGLFGSWAIDVAAEAEKTDILQDVVAKTVFIPPPIDITRPKTLPFEPTPTVMQGIGATEQLKGYLEMSVEERKEWLAGLGG